MTTFIEHIESIPGLELSAIRIYRDIDDRAEVIGRTYTTRHACVDELLSRQGSEWLRASCRALAEALIRDPSGKLAAIPDLYRWAGKPDGIGRHWVNWYEDFYHQWLIKQQQQFSQAAE